MLLLLSLSIAGVFAQDSLSVTPKKKKNVIFAELGGAGLLVSINYDRIILINKTFKLSVRGGFGLGPGNDNLPMFIFPKMINMLLGKSRGHLEIGAGNTFLVGNFADFTGPTTFRAEAWGMFFLGYRYQRPSGGLFLRAGYAPILDSYKFFAHWLSLGMGYSF